MVFWELSVTELIVALGYAGLTGIVFAESGILVGFFLPGDSLLVAAGLLASQGVLQLPYLLLFLSIAAIVGDSVGYWTGKRFGRKLFEREDSRFFKRKHLQRAEAFYQRHGGKTIFAARFMPFVRTFAPIAAGIAGMRYSRFIAYNVVGGIVWVFSMTLIGYFLGGLITNVDAFILPITALIIFVTLIPSGIHYLRKRSRDE